MKYLRLLIVLSVLAISLTGCTLLTNSFGYKDTAENFVDAIMEENYDKAVSFMAMEHELAKGTDIENLKQGLGSLREMVAQNFGTQLTYTFLKTEKTFTTGDNKQIPNTTVLHLQLENEKEFGYFLILFDDHSQKIMNIQLQKEKYAIPGMTTFWLFSVLVLAVLAFNIYMVVKVKRSNVTKKWRKYLVIILLNVPTIGWSAVGGFFFKLLNFQFMFGISFSMMGYLNSALAIGIPLGSLYVLWKFKNGHYETTDTDTTDYTTTEAIS